MNTIDNTFQSIFDPIEDVIAIINSDYEVESLNQRGKEIFGDLHLETNHIKCYELFCKKQSPNTNCPINCLKNKITAKKEHIIERYNHFFQVNITELKLPDGSTRYIEILHDITMLMAERRDQKKLTDDYQALTKEYQASLEKPEEKNTQLFEEKTSYEQLFSNMNAGFALHEIIVDKEGVPCDYRYIECNTEFERLTGLKRTEILGKTILEILPNIEKYWILNYGKVALTGEPFNFTNYSKELGKYYETRSYSPKKGFFAVTFYDVTKNIQYQNQLEQLNKDLETNLEQSQELNSKLEETLELVETKEQALQTIFNHATSVMILLDEKTEIIRINQTGLTFSGKSIESIMGSQPGDFFNCLGTKDNPCGCGLGIKCEHCTIRQSIAYTLKTGEDTRKIESELHVLDNKGNTNKLDLLVSSTIIRETNRKNVLVTIEDISQLKQQQEAVKESNEKYKALYENAPLAYQSIDIDGNIKDINPQWLKTLGYQRDEVIGKWFGDFLHPDEIQTFKKGFSTFKKEGVVHNIHYRMCKKDGTELIVSFEGRVGYTSTGEFKQTYCTFMDITLEQIAQKQLTESEKKFKEAFLTSPDAISITSMNGTLIEANSVFMQLTGMSYNELIGKNTGELNYWTHPNDHQHIQTQLIEKGKVENFETVFRSKTGQLKTVLLSASLINLQNRSHILSITRDISEIKLERHFLQKAQEMGIIGTWHLDIQNNMLTWTHENYRIFGIEPGTLLTFEVFLNCVHPDDREMVHTAWNEALAGKPYDIEHRIVVGKQTIWVHEKADFTFDENGKALTATGVAQDITQKKIQEEKILKANREQNLIFSHDPAFIIMKDTENNILHVSDKVVQMTGLTKENIEGRPSKEVYPEMSDAYYQDDLEVMNSRQPKRGIIEPLYDKNGNEQWLLTDKIPIIENNKVEGIILFATDITAFKLQERKIEEQKIMFETMFNAITEGIVITNTQREIQLANKGMFSTFGYEPDELIGKKTQILYADTESYDDAGQKVFNHNTHIAEKNYVTYYKDKNKRVFPGETFGSKLFDSEGKWIGNVGVMRDITERVKFIEDLKREKEKAEKADRLKTVFLANISHEVRTPLNAIMGFTEIIASKRHLSEQQRVRYGSVIRKSSENLLRIVNDILDISSLENGSLDILKKDFRLNQLLNDIYYIYNQKLREETRSLKIILKKPQENIILHTDESRLNQILSNLLDNALKFTDKGFVEFGIYNIEKGKISLYVRDTGIGIEKSHLPIIFDRFRQAEMTPNRIYGGNGLGLSIIKELLKLLDGDIWVETEPGQGSCFYIALPYQKELSIEEQNKNSPMSDQCTKKISILVVEDDPYNMLYIEEVLNDLNVETTIVTLGAEAIEKARNSMYAAILMDIRLPDMSGIEVTKQIRSFDTKTPIIAQTAYAMPSDKAEALSAGCTDYLSKPIRRELLINKLLHYTSNK